MLSYSRFIFWRSRVRVSILRPAVSVEKCRFVYFLEAFAGWMPEICHECVLSYPLQWTLAVCHSTLWTYNHCSWKMPHCLAEEWCSSQRNTHVFEMRLLRRDALKHPNNFDEVVNHITGNLGMMFVRLVYTFWKQLWTVNFILARELDPCHQQFVLAVESESEDLPYC
jgi:hypothetical protein